MEKSKHSKKDNRSIKSKILTGRHIFAVLISLFLIIGAYAIYRLISIERNYSAAQNEYGELREYSPIRLSSPDWIISAPDFSESELNPEQEQNIETALDLSMINPDYVGWIRIDGTVIDYPVVQGSDNIKYLNTTFRGERNSSGTIFMDTGCTGDFTGFTLLHGHNMRDGSMFADLNGFTGFWTSYPDIAIFTKDGKLLTFTIFDIKRTDNGNTLFSLPGKSLDAAADYFSVYGFSVQDFLDGTDILVLATCTSGHRDERLVVFAVNHRT